MSAQPLELRSLRRQSSNGVLADVPALHPFWIDSTRPWMTFVPPPVGDVVGAEDAWCERANFVKEDLAFLLSLEHHRFWSQLVHDQRVHKHLETLLQQLPRPHDLTFAEQTRNAKIRELLEEIMRRLFLVFVRLSTFKETKSDFISPDVFGKLIYDHFLLDIPRIMDLCVLFQSSSPKILERMVANVFMYQPAYAADLASSIESILGTMLSVSDRVDILTQMFNCDSPVKLDELRDLVSYITDIIQSIETFLHIFPHGAKVFHKQSFETRLAVFYQNVIVTLSRYVIKERDTNLLLQTTFDLLMSRLMLARKASVSILRHILQSCCLQPVLEGAAKETDYGLAETFIDVATNCLSEGALIVDYAKLHPLQEDFDIFTQAGITIDSTRIQYLLQGIESMDCEMQCSVLKVETKRFTLEEQVREAQRLQEKEDKANAGTSFVQEQVVNGVELESLIQQVKDLLPDLGDGFIKACLEYFDHNAEKVINSLFEDNLPPHLMDLPRTTARNASELKTTPGPLRHNIYNDDEFDINTKDSIDSSRVHRGKRKVAKNANALLDDKRELVDMKEKFSALGIVADEVVMTAGSYDADYDDEYDDTYDENAIGQGEPDAKDELTERRPFVLPRALGGGHVGKTIYVNDEDDEDEEEEQGRRKDDFVRNPADLRAEAEQRRQSKLAQRGGGRSSAVANPPRDVVGRAKGQGQEKSVLINRARKNANKGKQHRAMAERKQGRGMF